MAFNKSSMLKGKKQTAMPGPKSAAYKKRVAAGKKNATKSSDTPKPTNKRSRRAQAYSSVEARQRALERMKCAIWMHLGEINEGILKLAVSGNYLAAKALFDIAGVYALPPPEDEPQAMALPQSAAPTANPVSNPASDNEPPPAIDAFFRSIGVEPSPQHSGPEAASSSL